MKPAYWTGGHAEVANNGGANTNDDGCDLCQRCQSYAKR